MTSDTVGSDSELEFLRTERALGKTLDFDRVLDILEGTAAELESTRRKVRELESRHDGKLRKKIDDLENALADTRQTVRQAVSDLRQHLEDRTYSRANLESILSDLEVV